MRDTEAETQAEGKAGSMQRAQRGTPSQVSRIMPWAEGGAKPLSHLGCPRKQVKCRDPTPWRRVQQLVATAAVLDDTVGTRVRYENSIHLSELNTCD